MSQRRGGHVQDLGTRPGGDSWKWKLPTSPQTGSGGKPSLLGRRGPTPGKNAV